MLIQHVSSWQRIVAYPKYYREKFTYLKIAVLCAALFAIPYSFSLIAAGSFALAGSVSLVPLFFKNIYLSVQQAGVGFIPPLMVVGGGSLFAFASGTLYLLIKRVNFTSKPLSEEEKIGRLFRENVKVKKIAEGGINSIYSVKDPNVGKKRIFRVLKSRKNEDIFHSSVEIHRQLQKAKTPHIMKIYEVTDRRSSVKGILLKYTKEEDFFHGCTKMTLSEKLHILAQICEMMEYMHRLQLVHGDIKLENVLLVEAEEESLYRFHGKMIDFDFACRENTTLIGECRGSIFPPEIEFGNKERYVVSSTLDRWCLGMLIYNSVFRTKVTFKAQKEVEQFHEYLTEKKMPNEKIREALLGFLQPRPEDRITAAQGKEILAAWL